jgi:GNAT superfamily N-acetyltransferase
MQNADVRIRAAKLTDAADVAALMCQLGYETTPAEMEERLRVVLDNSAYTTLLAESAGGVCGMIGTFSQPSYEHNDLSGRIIALVVSKQGRRRGIGRALIAAAEKNFASKGVIRISLTTRLTRKDAHQFYEALGYERNGWRFVKAQRPTDR